TRQRWRTPAARGLLMVRKQGSPKNSVHHRTRTPERNQRRETSTHPRWQRADDGGETVRGAREPTPSAAPLSLHGGGAYHFPTGVAGAAPTVGNVGSHRAWKQGTRVRKHSPGTARPTPPTSCSSSPTTSAGPTWAA